MVKAHIIFQRNSLRAYITSGHSSPSMKIPFQNLEPKMMVPEMYCFKTNLAWETRLKSAIGKKALIYPLPDINCSEVGASFYWSILSYILPSCLVLYLTGEHQFIHYVPDETQEVVDQSTPPTLHSSSPRTHHILLLV